MIKKLKKIKIYMMLIIVLGILFFIINFVSGYMSKRVEVYVSNKVSLYCSDIITKAIHEEVVNNLDTANLVQFKTNSEEVVTSVFINTNQVNMILSKTSKSLINNIENIKKEKLTLPLGIILSDTLLFNLGPSINIRILPIGNIKTDIVSQIKDYGINNCLLEVNIIVKASVETIVPLKKGKVEIVCNIPLIIEILQGTVPRYYYNTTDTVPFINDD